MKALSIRQPWAYLIVNGYKSVENRKWPTKFRGEVLIHAGKNLDLEGLKWIKEHHPEINLPKTYQLGGIVGKAKIVDCVTTSKSPWFFGTYGFVFENAMPFPFVPYKGQLGFFEVKI
ncbi:MAG: ASCH domain-containing protein [Alphaproteobacteria bacterium]